jgi:hypothetical protein
VTAAQLDALRALWLAQHGLRLPASIPYFLAVSPSQEDPDGRSALVPACCALTAMGLSQLAPGGLRGGPGAGRGAALGRALAALEASRSLAWGPGGLRVVGPAAGDGEMGGGSAGEAGERGCVS